jgi:hypothetical protein
MPAVDGVCEECGFDYEAVDESEAGDALRAFGRRYRAPLTRGLPGEDLDALVRAHPHEGVWSALEYACHVRDVLAVQRERIALALAEDKPTLEPMGREERAVAERYNDQVPGAVVDALAANAVELASVVDALSDDDRARTAIYTYPTPTERDVGWVVRHTVHEGHHHLLDIGRVLRAARGR